MPQKPAGIQFLGQEYVIRELDEQFLSQAAHNHLPAPQGTPLCSPSAGSSVLGLLSLGKELGSWAWGLRDAPTQRGARGTAHPQLTAGLCPFPVSPQVWLLFLRSALFSASLWV